MLCWAGAYTSLLQSQRMWGLGNGCCLPGYAYEEAPF